VFDPYTPENRACRRSGIVTGLCDAHGRGRIIGIATGAQAVLLTPVGTPVNLIVMAPSGYRFANYTKFGAPIALWWLAVVAFVVPLHRSF
jgi:di/tricarboxylate transporter